MKNILSISEIKICDLINSDPYLYLDRKFKEDKVGKYYYDSKDSIKTIRKFKSYEVALSQVQIGLKIYRAIF